MGISQVGTKVELEMNALCTKCGRSVKVGSGYLVNRTTVCDKAEERSELGSLFPDRPFLCRGCGEQQARAEEPEDKGRPQAHLIGALDDSIATWQLAEVLIANLREAKRQAGLDPAVALHEAEDFWLFVLRKSKEQAKAFAAGLAAGS